MQPLFDRLLVKMLAQEEIKTEGGIMLATEDLNQQHIRGEVRFIGTEMKWVKEGDVVMFPKDAGSPIMMNDGEVLHLLRENIVDLVV